jgi:hypothetical protein
MVYLLNKQMNELIHDSDITPEELIQFEERIRENGKLAESKSFKSLYLLAVVSTIWFLIKLTVINKIFIFNAEINELSPLLLMLPPMAAFFYYQYALNASYVSAINGLLFEYYSQKHQPIERRNLIEFTFDPNILNIEWTFLSLMDKNSPFIKIGKIWTFFLICIFTFLPILLLLWMSFYTLTLPIEEFWLSIVSTIFVFVFMVRGIWVLWATRDLSYIPKSLNQKTED